MGATITCDFNANVLIQKVYPIDRVCWGPAEEQMIPLDKCLLANPGTIKFECGPNAVGGGAGHERGGAGGQAALRGGSDRCNLTMGSVREKTEEDILSLVRLRAPSCRFRTVRACARRSFDPRWYPAETPRCVSRGFILILYASLRDGRPSPTLPKITKQQPKRLPAKNCRRWQRPEGSWTPTPISIKRSTARVDYPK